MNFVPGSERVKISTLMGLLFVKATLVDRKPVAGFSSSDTERPWEVWGKSDYRFPINTRKKSVNFLPKSKRIKISDFMVWFSLKGTLVEPKTLAGDLSYETEGSWQVLRKTDCWFPIQPIKKSANFIPASERAKISNLMGWFFLKGTLVKPKIMALVSCYDTERPWKVWGGNMTTGLQLSREKNLPFSFHQATGS